MPVAYVLVTCEIGFEDKAMEQIAKLPCVEEVNRVTGVYDIVVKLSGSDLDLLREVIGKDMVKIREISFTHTLMADQIVWIAVIISTIGNCIRSKTIAIFFV